MSRHPFRFWCLASLLGVASSAADAARLQIGGSGPIDRPTNHIFLWCENAWSQDVCASPVDSFTADGDTAIVRFTVHNTPGANFRLDNVAVVERGIFDFYSQPVGSLAQSDYICARFADANVKMLDLAAIPSADIVYLTRFAGGIGPEWTFNSSQVSWDTGTTMFDDPFDPNAGTSTGAMAIGAGSGPAYVEVELAIPDVSAGTEYVLCYWSLSVPDTFPPENCLGANDDYEAKIFGVVEPATDTPASERTIWLGQNVPNPFNPRTQIEFELGQAAEASFEILDTRGRLVRRMQLGALPAGRHVLQWDGHDDAGRIVAAGVYVYRLQTATESWSKRMLLLK